MLGKTIYQALKLEKSRKKVGIHCFNPQHIRKMGRSFLSRVFSVFFWSELSSFDFWAVIDNLSVDQLYNPALQVSVVLCPNFSFLESNWMQTEKPDHLICLESPNNWLRFRVTETQFTFILFSKCGYSIYRLNSAQVVLFFSASSEWVILLSYEFARELFVLFFIWDRPASSERYGTFHFGLLFPINSLSFIYIRILCLVYEYFFSKSSNIQSGNLPRGFAKSVLKASELSE